MRKRILIDIDGTIADWDKQFINRMTEEHPHVKLLPYGTRTNKTKQQEREIYNLPETQEILAEKGFYRTLQLYPHAKNTLNQLIKDGNEVFICSMPSKSNPHSGSEKLLWVAEQLGEEWVQRTTLTFRKDLMDGDYLIDDHIQPATGRTSWKQILYTQSYNKHLHHLRRLNRWDYETVLKAINS